MRIAPYIVYLFAVVLCSVAAAWGGIRVTEGDWGPVLLILLAMWLAYTAGIAKGRSSR